MTIICAWCGKYLRGTGSPVSHGICITCAYKHLGTPWHELAWISVKNNWGDAIGAIMVVAIGFGLMWL